ncbi:hypothetical protein [Thermogemmatispora carboxidivorans]|uniref:hypothetical protein n=1 Tax=Thermogemmatispora carboxidivorans TaxID=1382306 RepID=UPI0006997990|nr:hypothetical protein [Thermogemmatispora carboxidivorans]
MACWQEAARFFVVTSVVDGTDIPQQQQQHILSSSGAITRHVLPQPLRAARQEGTDDLTIKIRAWPAQRVPQWSRHIVGKARSALASPVIVIERRQSSPPLRRGQLVPKARVFEQAPDLRLLHRGGSQHSKHDRERLPSREIAAWQIVGLGRERGTSARITRAHGSKVALLLAGARQISRRQAC